MLKALLVALVTVAMVPASASPDEDAVRGVLMTAFDKPEARLVVEPIVVSGGYAIADWTQVSTGGRALLRRGHHGWDLILCAGDELKNPDALRLAGLSTADAAGLAAALASSEVSLPRERLARLSSFEGIVRMGEGNHAHH